MFNILIDTYFGKIQVKLFYRVNRIELELVYYLSSSVSSKGTDVFNDMKIISIVLHTGFLSAFPGDGDRKSIKEARKSRACLISI